jgi:ribonuclease P protein component
VKSIYRLKKDAEFKSLIAKKKILRSSSFIVYFFPNELAHVRVGISVSKKIGNAVVRNKIKRQVKASLARLLDYAENKDYLFIIKSDYLKKDFKTIYSEINSILNQTRRPLH